MSGNDPTIDNEWVRLNVGGKVFQTTKETLSRYPESFLARLANGALPSDKDEAGAYFIDRSYEHFDTILNYFRSGVLNLDRSEKSMKDLLCEADFYNIFPLVEEIQNVVRSVSSHAEAINMTAQFNVSDHNHYGTICFSEPQEDYEVMQILRGRTQIEFEIVHKGRYSVKYKTMEAPLEIHTVLRGFGFVQESYDDISHNCTIRKVCWKFAKPTFMANRTEAITMCIRYDLYNPCCVLLFSEIQDDYEVLQKLRDRTPLNFGFVKKGHYRIISFAEEDEMEYETVLRGFGFTQESYDDSFYNMGSLLVKCLKFVRTVSK